MKLSAFFLLLCCCAGAEVRTMTLKQSLDLAMMQSPDLMLSRLDQQKARQQVTIGKDPFSPKIYGGSGAAWTYGYPTSIDGNAPSIFEAKTSMALLDRSQSYQVAQASESLRGAEIDIAARQDDVAFRVASLFLDAEQISRSFAAAQRQVDNLTRVRELVDVRVSEGRELAIESKKANVAVLRAKQAVENLAGSVINVETALAMVLGLDPDDRVRAAAEERPALETPGSEEASVEQALENSKELKRLQSNLQVKTLEIKGYKAQRLPKVDLVAQYSMLAPYNNFQDFFRKFQRNNVELGASFQIPLLMGRASRAYVSQAEIDSEKLRIQVSQTRSRITADLRRAYQEVRRTESARELARADLDLAREQIDIDLALLDEGRLPQTKVEQDRAVENEKWLAYYDAQHASERARLDVLRQTGTLLTALK